MRTAANRTHAPEERRHTGAVLLTGATGLVGMEVLARFLERTDRPVFCLVRGRDRHEASERLQRTVTALLGDAEPYADRLVALPGDIQQPGLGLERVDDVAEAVTDVVHGAASVSFELGLRESRAINVEGTRRMLELAALCDRRGGLRSFSYVSTAYVAGTHRGRFGEDDLEAGQGFRNAYEQSKYEAERLVREHAAALPVSVFRPSIIVGDRRTGWTQAFNVLYGPLRAFARGAYPMVPARRSAPVDVVSVDYVADAIFTLVTARPAEGRTYNLTAGDDVSTVGELVDLAAERFDRPRPVSVPPAVYRRALHPLLLRVADPRKRRALARTEAYFPYFAVDTWFDDARARDALRPAGVRPAPLAGYFDRIVDFALRADWGREAVTRHRALREAGR